MIRDLSTADSEYLKKHLIDARGFQEKEFKSKIDVELYQAYYAGEDYRHDSANQIYSEDEFISLNKTFPATNRVVPSLYFQNPKIVFTPKKNSTEFSAKVLTAKVNYDFREMKVKKENQMTVLDAWYCGFGAAKIGYQTQFQYKDKPKDKGMIEKTIDKVMGKSDNDERIIDYIEYEGSFVRRINPKFVYRDPKQPAGKDRFIWLQYPKTLEDITTSDVYEYDSDFYTRFGSKDPREVEIQLFEGWLRTRKGLYIVAMCDGYSKPIRWEKSSWQGDDFPISFLSFAEVNDLHYPPSFMKVTAKQQKHVNYLTTLQFNVINKFRNQTAINEKALSEEGERAIKENSIGGIIKFKQPVAGNIAPINSAPIPADLFNVANIMSENLQECLQVAGLRSGGAQNEPTLGQDQIKEFGNTIGLSGMQDKVREFVIDEARKLSQMIKQYATAPSLVPITGVDLKDPQTGKLVTDEWLEFGTPEQPITLRQAVAGDYDVDVDIKTAQRPDDATKLKLFGDMANMLFTNPMIGQVLAQAQDKINWGKFLKGWFDAYSEYIPEAGTFIEKMSQQEIMQAQAQAKQAQAIQDKAIVNADNKDQLEQQKSRLDIEKGLQEMEHKDTQLLMDAIGGDNGKPQP